MYSQGMDRLNRERADTIKLLYTLRVNDGKVCQSRFAMLVSRTQNPYQPVEEMLSVQVGHYGLVREFDWSKSKYHRMLFSLTNTY